VNGPLGSAQTGVKHMQLITSAQRQKLLENGRAQRAAINRQDQCLDFEPVVKLFTESGPIRVVGCDLSARAAFAFEINETFQYQGSE
jgi:hypothetical protein